jgi:general secretion pathway protein K
VIRAARWIWTELTRPRGSVTHRFYRVGRSSRSGVALLVVIAAFLFMTVLAAQIASTAAVRISLASNLRDEAKAEYLAKSGLNFYRLILVAANGMDSKLGAANLPFDPAALGISGDMLWQMVPFINTNLMRMIFVSGGDLDDEEQLEMAEKGLTDEQLERTREASSASSSKPGFLDFEGDFFAEVNDESRRINIKNIQGNDVASLQQDPAASQLLALMTGRNTCAAIRADRQASIDDTDDNTQFFMDRSLEPLELVGNLADWVDKNTTRAYLGGNEDSVYDRLEEPYRAKNAPFDTLEEVRLVDGWHRDDVWEKFGANLTVFGDGKVNVNTADCEVLWALLKTHVQPPPADQQVDLCVRGIEQMRAMIPFSSERQFVQFVRDGQAIGGDINGQPLNNVQGQCSLTPAATMNGAVTTKTKVFRVTSVGTVGNASVKIEAVFDFSGSVEGKTLYWRID